MEKTCAVGLQQAHQALQQDLLAAFWVKRAAAVEHQHVVARRRKVKGQVQT
jgi:hypothetical protein